MNTELVFHHASALKLPLLPLFEISAWKLETGGEGRGASLNYYEHKTTT